MTAAVNIRRGRLSEDEKATIAALAERHPNPYRIAGILNRHPATINWHMLTNGLLCRKPQYLARSYVRGGRTVHPWEPRHDVRLLAVLLECERTAASALAAYRSTAAQLTEEFGIFRDHHSVRVRATILAAAEDAP
jgi:hypothetical protein